MQPAVKKDVNSGLRLSPSYDTLNLSTMGLSVSAANVMQLLGPTATANVDIELSRAISGDVEFCSHVLLQCLKR